MTTRRCDACGAAFDDGDWYPVAFDPDGPSIREFCSVACKRRYQVTPR